MVFVCPSATEIVTADTPFLLISTFNALPTGAVSTLAVILLNVTDFGAYHLFVPVVIAKVPVCLKFKTNSDVVDNDERSTVLFPDESVLPLRDNAGASDNASVIPYPAKVVGVDVTSENATLEPANDERSTSVVPTVNVLPFKDAGTAVLASGAISIFVAPTVRVVPELLVNGTAVLASVVKSTAPP